MHNRQLGAVRHLHQKSSPKTPPDTNVTRAPTRRYHRDADLPKLVGLWPNEVADTSYVGRLRVLAKLRRALRSERQRGLGGHWSYDLARHHQLLEAYRAETAALLSAARTDEIFNDALDVVDHAVTTIP